MSAISIMPHERDLDRPADAAPEAKTFDEGYREGWLSVAGEEPLPKNPTQPPPGEPRDYLRGFFYGRADALERFQPHA